MSYSQAQQIKTNGQLELKNPNLYQQVENHSQMQEFASVPSTEHMKHQTQESKSQQIEQIQISKSEKAQRQGKKINKWHILGFICGILFGFIIFEFLIQHPAKNQVKIQLTKTRMMNSVLSTSPSDDIQSQTSINSIIMKKQSITQNKQKSQSNDQIIKKSELQKQVENTSKVVVQKQTNQKKQVNSQKQQQKKSYFGIFYQSKDKVPQQRKVTAVFTTCCNRYDLLQISLATFFQYSTFPYQEVIIVVDGNATVQENKVLQSFKQKNIIIIETKTKVGQINAIDQAYANIKTPYIFHSEDDWEYLCSGFVEESLVWLQRQPELLQVWIQKHDLPIQKQTRKSLSKYTLSFNPGLRRLNDYTPIESYTKLTNNQSYGLGAGMAQQFLAEYYLKRHRYVVQTQTEYTRHLGTNRGSKKSWQTIRS